MQLVGLVLYIPTSSDRILEDEVTDSVPKILIRDLSGTSQSVCLLTPNRQY